MPTCSLAHVKCTPARALEREIEKLLALHRRMAETLEEMQAEMKAGKRAPDAEAPASLSGA